MPKPNNQTDPQPSENGELPPVAVDSEPETPILEEIPAIKPFDRDAVQVVRHVLDADTGEHVAVTHEMAERFAQVDDLMAAMDVMKGIALAVIVDEKLYLAGGYSSFKEYVEERRGMAYRTALRYLKIGRKNRPLFPHAEAKLLPSASDVLDPSENGELPPVAVDSDRISAISGLGSTKLAALAGLDDDEYEQLVKGGELINAETGERVSIEDLHAMNKHQVLKLVAERTSEIEARLAKEKARREEEEELRQTAEAERDHYRTQLEDREEMIRDAAEIQWTLGARKGTIEDKRKRLREASDAVNNAIEALFRVGADDDDPETLLDDFFYLISKMEEGAQRVRSQHPEARAKLIGLKG